jgi:hypothetical protein
MKRLLLIISAGVISLSGYSQTHSDLSGNKKTLTGRGYTWEFNGDALNNCFEGGGVAYDGNSNVNNQQWSVGSGILTVDVPAMTSYDDARQRLKFYSGDCSGTTVNLNNTTDRRFKISLNSPANGQLVLIFYSGTQTNYSAPTPPVYDITAGDNVLDITNIDLTGITDFTQVDAIGMFFRGPTGWGDYNFSGTVTINYLLVGDAVTLSNNKDAVVDNSLITVFPNPANEELTVDLAKLNGKTATVKILNQYGAVLKEEIVLSASSHKISVAELEKGMYLVQVSSEDKISNKKVVVE